MRSWIIFSIGVSTHFYIYSKNGVDTSIRIPFEKTSQVADIIASTDCAHITFVTRYETDEEFLRDRHIDAVVDRLRAMYPSRAAPAESQCLCRC